MSLINAIKKLSRAFSTPTDVKEDDADLRVTKSGSFSHISRSTKIRHKPLQDNKRNRYFDHLQIFDVQDGVQCIKVIDECRISVGLVTGRILIWDTSLGTLIHRLHNHQTPVKLLELVKCGHRGIRLLSAGKDDLINIWDLDSGKLLKGFVLKEHLDDIRLIHHVQRIESPDQVSLLCLQTELILVQVNLVPPMSNAVKSSPVHRIAKSSHIVDVLETNAYVICVSDVIVEVFVKQWDEKLGLTLKQTDKRLKSDGGSLYSCSALISEESFALGSHYGKVYIYSLKNDTDLENPPQVFDMGILQVRELKLVNKAWMVVTCHRSVHLVHMGSGDCCYRHQFTSDVVLVAVSPHGLLLTLCADSLFIETWDLSNFVFEKNHSVKEDAQQLPYQGLMSAHDDMIKGVDIVPNGIVTYGSDSLLIVWKNKDDELMRLISSMKEDSLFEDYLT